jgi:hypothetical protein
MKSNAMTVSKSTNEKFNFQLKPFFFLSLSTADIISSSASTEAVFNEYDSSFDDDLRNEIYPSPYNAATPTAGVQLTMLIFIVFVTFFSCL